MDNILIGLLHLIIFVAWIYKLLFTDWNALD